MESESFDYKGYSITITNDGDAESPRDWDNVGKMYCSHREYDLGDEQFDASDFDGWAEVKTYLKKERKASIILPLGLYDHSGITMYVGDNHDRWDGGQVGFIYCTAADIKREWDGDRKKAEEYLRAEVKTYDQYLRGEIYSYSVTDEEGRDIDDLGGCYGYDYTVDEAKAVVDEDAKLSHVDRIRLHGRTVAPYAVRRAA